MIISTTMIQSEFNYKVYVALPFVLAFSVLTLLCLIHFEETFTGLGGGIFVLFILSFINFLMVFAIVKTQKFSTDTNQIFVDGILGWGITKVYALNEISGYYTGKYTAKGNTEIITYVTVKDKKIARLSNGYHKNFIELMAFIEGNLTNLGPLEITIISEFQSSINTKNKLNT